MQHINVIQGSVSDSTCTRYRRRRGVRFWVMYCIIVLSLVLMVTEICARVLGLAPSLTQQWHGFVPDANIPLKLRPSSTITGSSRSGEYNFRYETNSLGLRDVEHTLAKPDGVIRILGLGDSFTEGAGAAFEETYLFLLEKSLNARISEHQPIEIIKAGLSNYFPAAENLMLEHYGLQFDPDIVIVGFFINDVTDTYHGLKTITLSELDGTTMRYPKELGPISTWLYVHSDAARVVLHRYVTYKLSQVIRNKWKEVFQDDGIYEPYWMEIESQFTRMVELVSPARLVVMYIPDNYLGFERQVYAPARLARWCAANDVIFVDALPAIRRAYETQQSKQNPIALYWEIDGHCTPAGYQVLADVLYKELIDANLAP